MPQATAPSSSSPPPKLHAAVVRFCVAVDRFLPASPTPAVSTPSSSFPLHAPAHTRRTHHAPAAAARGRRRRFRPRRPKFSTELCSVFSYPNGIHLKRQCTLRSITIVRWPSGQSLPARGAAHGFEPRGAQGSTFFPQFFRTDRPGPHVGDPGIQRTSPTRTWRMRGTWGHMPAPQD